MPAPAHCASPKGIPVTQTIQSRYDWFLERLRAHGSRVITRGPSTAIAQCPAHRDRTPSLAVSIGDTAVVLTCHGGCNPQDIMAALSLTYGDLWPDDGTRRIATPSTWKAYADSIKVENERDRPPSATKPTQPSTVKRGPVVAKYRYRDEHGETVGVKIRYQLIDTSTGEIVGKSFTQHAMIDGDQQDTLAGVTLPIYNLPEVLSGIRRGIPIWLTEGEKDADTLTHHGCIATTFAGGANGKLLPEVYSALTGADLRIIVDRDAAGHTYANRLHTALNPTASRIRYYTAATGKDVTDHLDAGHNLDDLVPHNIDPDTEVDVVETQLPDDTTPTREPAATSTWTPRPILDITRELAKETPPDILTREDGKSLLYRGRINGFIGEAESGKTWLALHAVKQQLDEGQTVIWTDFEDSPNGILARLIALNLTDKQLARFHYLRPEEAYGNLGRLSLLTYVYDLRPSLIVTDGVNAAMTLLGLDINSNNDASHFFQHLLHPLTYSPDTRPGAAVAYIDHVAKNKENRSKGPLGAGAKRAMTTGCTISVAVKAYPAPGRTGELKLRVDKDRPGLVRAEADGPKANLGLAIIESLPGNNVNIKIKPPTPNDDDDDDDIALPEPRKALNPKDLARIILGHRYTDTDHHGTHQPTNLDKIRHQLRDSGQTAGNELTSKAVVHLKTIGCIDDRYRWIKPYPETEPTP